MRTVRWGAALGLGALWWWSALRLVLSPGAGALEATVVAGGWGLSLLPVHCVPKGRGRPAGAGPGGSGNGVVHEGRGAFVDHTTHGTDTGLAPYGDVRAWRAGGRAADDGGTPGAGGDAQAGPAGGGGADDGWPGAGAGGPGKVPWGTARIIRSSPPRRSDGESDPS